MIEAIYFTIIGILIFNFSFSLFLERLNYMHKPNHLPSIISDVYDSENYAKQQTYEKEKLKVSLIQSVISSSVIIIFFALKGFGFIQEYVSTISQSMIFQTLLFFGFLGLTSLIISIPFDYYETFVVEERFGFNKSTQKLFFIDAIKSILIAGIIGGAILLLITWLYMLNPKVFWISALVVMLVFSLIMNALYSTIILPLFNKKSPLPDGELRDRVIEFASSLGFSINNIYVIDGSKRSAKANAFFTGFGRKKRIFLYDTLTNNLSNDEIVAVLAHELGHYRKHHIWINMTIGVVQTALILFFFGMISESILFTKVMGGVGDSAVFYLNALCFVMLIEPIQTVFEFIKNSLSRRMEYEADRYTAEHGMGEFLVTALKKISSLNYSNLTPHPFYVFINYSHPTLYDRIMAINVKVNK